MIPSIDTLKIKIPLDHHIYKAAHDHLGKYFMGVKFVPFGNDYSDRVVSRLQLLLPEQQSMIPSHWTPLTCSFLGEKFMVWEFSVPKVVYGHQLAMFYDLKGFLEVFKTYLESQIKIDLPSTLTWVIARLDTSINFLLPSRGEVEMAMDILSKMRYLNKPSDRKINKVMAFWPMSTRTIKFYDKYKEVKAHKKSYVDETIFKGDLGDYLSLILRYEESWKPPYLRSLLGVRKNDMVTVEKFLEYCNNHYTIDTHLEWINKNFQMTEKRISMEHSINLVKQNFRKSQVYIDFLYKVADKGLDELKKDLPARTYHYRVGKLKKIGVDVTLFHERFYNEAFKNLETFDIYLGKDNIVNLSDQDVPETLKQCIPVDPIKETIRNMYFDSKKVS